MKPPDDVPCATASGNGRSDVETDERERRYNAAIRELIEARESGAEPDRQAWLARYPELHQRLTDYLETDDQVHWLVHTVVPAEPASGIRFGPYRIVRVIGKGGMGVVYEVEESRADRRLALKVLPTCGLPDPENRARFRREAESLTQLDHPNIVPILAFHEIGGIPAIVMPLIEGMDLRTIRRQLERARRGAASSDREAGAAEPESHVVANPDKPDDQSPLDGTSPPWRAIALIGLQAARALAHAHGRGILHRDVKPSNLVLDRRGSVLLTDFGLADPAGAGQADITATGDVVGTLRYLAPERLRGWCDPRSDVYSLGLTLYELLTLRPAFDELDRSRLLRAVEGIEPTPPGKLRSDIPRDLETIVLKAIEKEPSHRYQSAGDLAEDIRRFLDGRPIAARRAGLLDRAGRWTYRHRGMTAAGIVSLLVVLLVLVVSIALIRGEQQKALNAAKLASDEKQKAVAAAQDSRYESLAQTLLRIFWTPHHRGWSDEARKTIDEMAAIRNDDRLRSLATAARRGFDAHVSDSISPGGGSLLFDPAGKRLLIASVSNANVRGEDRGSTIWELAARTQHVSKIRGNGPVAFRPDGTPLQLAHDDLKTLRLWDVARETVVGEFTIPVAGDADPDPADHPHPVFYDRALAADGSRVAASIKDPEGRPYVFVWDVVSGRLLHRFAGRAQCLAFSHDGSLLAGGEDAGKVHIWGIPEGVEVSSPWQGPSTVSRLAFGRDLRRSPGLDRVSQQPGRGWRLAAGDLGGNVTIWDAETGMLHERCKGGSSAVEALAFSPDGTLVAAGRNGAIDLWDVAGGALLLDLDGLHHCLSLAFSPDGRFLASGSAVLTQRDATKDSSTVSRWKIENGRGIRTLRGLVAPIEKFRFSPDGKRLAALASDWRLAIWDRRTGALEHILQPPEGTLSDNAAFAFSPDGSRFAFASGDKATLWDLNSGSQLAAWSLPPGLGDLLAFPRPDRILLFRVETKSGTRGPYRDAPYEQHPRVCRVRELLDPGRLRTVVEIADFNRHVFDDAAPDDLGYVVVDGVNIDPTGTHRSITAFNGATGKPLWSIPILAGPVQSVTMRLDPTAQVLCVGQGDHSRCDLYRLPVGTPIGSMGEPESLGPGADVWISQAGVPGVRETFYQLFHRGDDRPVLILGTDAMPTIAGRFRFSADGRSLAWANSDGTVDVTELGEVQHSVEPAERR